PPTGPSSGTGSRSSTFGKRRWPWDARCRCCRCGYAAGCACRWSCPRRTPEPVRTFACPPRGAEASKSQPESLRVGLAVAGQLRPRVILVLVRDVAEAVFDGPNEQPHRRCGTPPGLRRGGKKAEQTSLPRRAVSRLRRLSKKHQHPGNRSQVVKPDVANVRPFWF